MATQEDEYAKLLAQANYELSVYGQVTDETQESLDDYSSGVKGLSKATKLAYQGVKQLGDAVGKTASAMYKGEKGASAYNGALDSMGDAADSASKALFALGGPFGLIAGAISFLIGKAIKATKVVNEQLDNQYNAFQALSKSGAAASDGMQGAFQGMQKLRLSVAEFQKYGDLIASNAKELAVFGGTVFQGRKKFENASAALEPYRLSMLKLGMNQEAQNEGLAAYIGNETRMGRAQKKTSDELAAGAYAYLKEQDALTKVTGVERADREKARQEAQKEQQYASKLRDLQLNGNDQAVKNFEAVNDMMHSLNPEAAKAVRAAMSGNLASAESQKIFGTSVGKVMELNDKLEKNLITPAEYAQEISKAVGEQSDRIGSIQGQFEQYDNYNISFAAGQKLRLAYENDFFKNYQKAVTETATQAEGKVDPLLQNMAEADKANRDAMLNAQATIQLAAPAASKAMLAFAKATEAATRNLVGLGSSQEEKYADYQKQQEKIKKQQEEAAKKWGENMPWWLGGDKKEEPPQPPAEPPAKPAAPPPPPPPVPNKQQMTQQQLAERGLKIKKGDVQAEGASLSTKLLEIAQQVQSSVPGFAYFSGFNDKYHQEKSPASQHTKGLAADFALASKPDEAMGKKIVDAIKGMGASLVIDEYNHPSSKATAGHIHFQVPEAKAARGGVFPARPGGTNVLLAEGGQDEAVIPMKNGAVQVSMKNPGPLPDMAYPDIETMFDEEFSSTVSQDIRTDLRAVVQDIMREIQPVDSGLSQISQALMDQLDQLIEYQKQANDLDASMLSIANS